MRLRDQISRQLHGVGSTATAGASALFLIFPGSAAAIDLRPKVFPLAILGISVRIPVAISFQARSEGDALLVDLNAIGRLGDIQSKALEIARRLPMPRDNCAHKGINVVVNSIDDAKITPDGKTAVVELAGHVTVWACIDLGIGTGKTTVASDSVRLTIPVELVVVSRKEIRLKLARQAQLNTGHPLTGEAARVLVGDLNEKLSGSLSGIFDAAEARATLPEMPGAEIAIDDARFAADGTELTVRAVGNGRLTSEAFNRGLEFLSK